MGHATVVLAESELQERVKDIASNLPSNATPQEIVNAAWAIIATVPKHRIVLQSSYDAPTDGGAFGFSIIVTLLTAAGKTRLANAFGDSPVEALRDLPRALKDPRGPATLGFRPVKASQMLAEAARKSQERDELIRNTEHAPNCEGFARTPSGEMDGPCYGGCMKGNR